MINKHGDSRPVQTAFDDYSTGLPKAGTSRVDPVVRAVGRKLLRNNTYASMSQFGVRRSLDVDHTALFNHIVDHTSTDIQDARNAMQLLPDIEIMMNLLVSSILAPKDLVTVELTYSLRNKVIRSEAAKACLDVLREHFDTYHKIKSWLTPCLEDILVKTGSYPMLVIAENTVDQVINGRGTVTMESLRSEMDQSGKGFRHVGFLGSPTLEGRGDDAIGLESLFSKQPVGEYAAESPFLRHLTITDNPNVLKLERVRDRIRTDRTNQLLSKAHLRTAMETHDAAGDLVESLYRTRNYQIERTLALPSGGAINRPTVGHPLVMKLPSESVIPVHEPANPEKHLGYFIVLDINGNPVHKALEQDYYREMTSNYTMNQAMISAVLRDTKRIQDGLRLDTNLTSVQQLEVLYGEILEKELNLRLKRGVYGSGATVARPEEIYRIMLSRALAGKGTQLLYVPAEMLTYMAFDYNQYGIGVSLLQKSIILAGQRANLSIASVMAELKNAVARSKVSITLDEEDDDPSGTVEHIITEHAKLRNGAYPMSIYAPNDIINWLQNAAVEFEVNGNTGYPSTKVDISDFNSQKPVPNLDLQKDLRDRHSWAFNIPPELIDTARGAEFATSIVTNNLMLIKTVMRYQEMFTPFLEQFIRCYTLSDGILIQKLRDVLTKLKSESRRDLSTTELEVTAVQARDQISGSRGDDVDRMIVDFLYDLQIDLPKPEGAKTDNLKAAYDKQKEFLDLAIEAYISDAAISYELSGDIGQHGDVLKNAISAMFMRRWLRENGALPMLDELIELGENGSPGLDLMAEIEAHSSPMKINLRDFIVKYLRRKAADNAVLQTVEEQTATDAGSGSTSAMSSDTGGGDDGGGSDMGGGNMDFDMDFESGGGGDDTGDATGGSSETSESSSTETSTSADGTTTTSSSSSSSSSSETVG